MNLHPPHRQPSVLVFAGLDPSGGAGIQADIEAIAAMGAHALPIVTTLTVQDNDRVHAIRAVEAALLSEQAAALLGKLRIAAVKIGIVGSRANVAAIADILRTLRTTHPELPVVLDPVLASGHGDALTHEDAVALIEPLLPWVTLLTPNLPEAVRLCQGETAIDKQVASLLAKAPHLLIKGGHGDGQTVTNRWFSQHDSRSWQWPRLEGSFHGSGCTLASAIAGCLARGLTMPEALERAQSWVQQALASAYSIAEGQKIPRRAKSH